MKRALAILVVSMIVLGLLASGISCTKTDSGQDYTLTYLNAAGNLVTLQNEYLDEWTATIRTSTRYFQTGQQSKGWQTLASGAQTYANSIGNIKAQLDNLVPPSLFTDFHDAYSRWLKTEITYTERMYVCAQQKDGDCFQYASNLSIQNQKNIDYITTLFERASGELVSSETVDSD